MASRDEIITDGELDACLDEIGRAYDALPLPPITPEYIDGLVVQIEERKKARSVAVMTDETQRRLLTWLTLLAAWFGMAFGFLVPAFARPLDVWGQRIWYVPFVVAVGVIAPFGLSEGISKLRELRRLGAVAWWVFGGSCASMLGASLIALWFYDGTPTTGKAGEAGIGLPIALCAATLGVIAGATWLLLEGGEQRRARGEKLRAWAANAMLAFVPLAVFCRVAGACSHGFQQAVREWRSLEGLIVVVLAGLVLCALVLAAICHALSGRASFLVQAGPAVGFLGSSSWFALPITQASAQKAGVSEASAKTVIPVGATFNKMGTALFVTAAILSAQTTDHSLDKFQIAAVCVGSVVISALVAGVPHGSLGVVAFVQGGLGLPGQGALIVVDVVLDRLRTAVNVAGNVTLALVVDRCTAGPRSPVFAWFARTRRRFSTQPEHHSLTAS